jgi:preprotein translocase subunit SecF
VTDSVIQNSLDKQDEVLIKVPLLGSNEEVTDEEQRAQVDAGRARVKTALDSLGKEAAIDLGSEPDAAYKIIGTEAVGAIAGSQLRNQAVAVTLLGLLGILLYIGFRYDWTYGMGAIIAVLHDVLIAALLTLVGFSVNDTIVIFDRIRENVGLNRRESLYTLTNTAINQTMSRTVITGGLVFLSVLALVLFGGEVLRGFSLALFVGVITGTYSTIAIASPIALWWEKLLGAKAPKASEPASAFASSARRGVARQPKAENMTKTARS